MNAYNFDFRFVRSEQIDVREMAERPKVKRAKPFSSGTASKLSYV